MIIRLLIPILLVCLDIQAVAQVSVRIFAREKPSSVVFTPLSDGFRLTDGVHPAINLGPYETVVITRYGEKVIYMIRSGESHVTDSLTIQPPGPSSRFTLRAMLREESLKQLSGPLLVRSFPGSLLVLNITTVEEMLPGVVRAEAGAKGPSEYFRAQAVVARTYAWRNADRHRLDGFNLCDDTHCQVYPGLNDDAVINAACKSTQGKVIVWTDSVLINSAFHANCGGVTASSADVWVAPYPYLVPVTDPWCSNAASSAWTRTITTEEWKTFIRSKGIAPGQDTLLFSSPGSAPARSRQGSVGGLKVTAEDIRQHFRLRSSYFTITSAGSSVKISGRGYGHGVGLCQDGARNMAASGKKYAEITAFYYPGTFITDVKNARQPKKP